MSIKTVCIFGGSGFVGRHLATRLRRDGWHCVVPTRRPHRHRDLELVPNLRLRAVDRFDQTTLRECVRGCDALVDLVGILNQTPRTPFEAVHVEFVRALTDAAAAEGVGRLIQMSALNADARAGTSAYLRSKGAGEALAHAAAGLEVTSVRPSLIFGRGDRLFNRFASLLALAPGVMPLACPKARFAPVWVRDVCEAMARALADPHTAGQRYDLCGPRELTLEELVAYTARQMGRRVWILGLDDRWSRRLARLFERLPGQPLTLDNYLSMQTSSVCAEHNGLLELGIHPSDIEAVVPFYLSP